MRAVRSDKPGGDLGGAGCASLDSPHRPHSPLLGWGAVLEGEGGAGSPDTCREARAEASSGGRPLLGVVA